HQASDGAAVLACLEVALHLGRHSGDVAGQRGGVAHIAKLAVEVLADEIGGAAGDVDVLADQVAVDPGDEVVGVEVEVFDVRIELGGDVVTQPLRVHADFKIAQGRDARAPAFGHLFAADGNETVDVQAVRRLAAREL